MSGKLVPEVNAVTQEYWDGTAQGELRIRHCPECDTLFRFGPAWCPECGHAEMGWKPASGKGVVTNHSTIHVPPYEAYADDVPYVLALIDLEEGVRMMANIVDCAPEAVHIGLPVEVVFETRGDVQLPQFRPQEQGQ